MLSRAKRPPLNTVILMSLLSVSEWGEKPGTGAWKAVATTTVKTRAEAGLVFLLEEDEKKAMSALGEAKRCH